MFGNVNAEFIHIYHLHLCHRLFDILAQKQEPISPLSLKSWRLLFCRHNECWISAAKILNLSVWVPDTTVQISIITFFSLKCRIVSIFGYRILPKWQIYASLARYSMLVWITWPLELVCIFCRQNRSVPWGQFVCFVFWIKVSCGQQTCRTILFHIFQNNFVLICVVITV